MEYLVIIVTKLIVFLKCLFETVKKKTSKKIIFLNVMIISVLENN